MSGGGRHIHVIAVAGYAASGAALLARQLGNRVTGSDEHAYPPVSEMLTASGIEWANHYSVANLDRFGTPDLVVVSNTARPDNVELVEARRRGLQVVSEAEFFTGLTGDRERVAVCGTHGKSTTATLLAHMLERCGLDPGLRLGAVALDFGASSRLGTGPFVFEGDEYATAPWDPRPKFMHIHPRAACVTRVEHDHPDLYPSFEEYRECFVALVRELPADGLLALCADDDHAFGLGAETRARVITYGESPRSDWRIMPSTRRSAAEATGAELQHFEIGLPEGDSVTVRLTFPGSHNRQNAAAALVLAGHLGAPLQRCVDACADFQGPARRFQVLGESGGVTVVDDYGHHPTEVEVTVRTAVERYPGRRIITVCVPHTYSRTRSFLHHYRRCFIGSDSVILGPIEAARERHLPATVSSEDVAGQVRAAAEETDDVLVVPGAAEALAAVLSRLQPGTVVLCISLGGFEGFAGRLLAAVRSRDG